MDPDHIRELFSQFRPVEVRRMFGGAGIIADGLTFAIVFEGAIFFQADETSIAAFKEEGATPFVYPYAKRAHRRDPDKSPFWRMPERLYDDPEEAARWAERALEVARRKKAGRRVKSRAKKPAVEKTSAGKPPAKKPPPKKSPAKKSSRKPGMKKASVKRSSRRI